MGVEDPDRLPDSHFSASSFYNTTPLAPLPSKGRLNGEYAWCANSRHVSAEYLVIRVPYAEIICAIATQGNGYKYSDPSVTNSNEAVTEYEVEYSVNGNIWNKIEKVSDMPY